MQIVHSQRHDTHVKVPITPSGGALFEVQFTAGRAIVPDAVADALVATSGGFYTSEGPVGDALRGKQGQRAKVLIIRDTGLGDVLLLTPLIRKLATEAKAAVVDVLTEERYRCLFAGNPHMRRTYALENLPENQERPADCDLGFYDVVLDLRLVVENAEAVATAGQHRHRADAFAAYGDLKLTEEERHLDYYIDASEFALPIVRAVAEAKEARYPEGHDGEADKAIYPAGVIGYVLRASATNRSWSKATHTAAISALVDAGYIVVVIDQDAQPAVAAMGERRKPADAGGSASLGAVLDYTGKTSIRETAAIFQYCDAVITPDTGLFHLAGALDIPTITYFGAFPVAERAAHTQLTVLNDAAANCALAPCRSYRCLNRDGEGQPRCLAIDATDLPGLVRGAIARAALGETPEATELAESEPESSEEKQETSDADRVGRPEQDGGATPSRESDSGNGGPVG